MASYPKLWRSDRSIQILPTRQNAAWNGNLHKRRYNLFIFIISAACLVLLVDVSSLTKFTRKNSTVDSRLREGCSKRSEATLWSKMDGAKDEVFSVDVYQSYLGGEVHSSHPMKNMEHMLLAPQSDDLNSSGFVKHVIFDGKNDRRGYLGVTGRRCYTVKTERNKVLMRFDKLVSEGLTQYAAELWKYCALADTGGAIMDHNSPLLQPFRDIIPVHKDKNGGRFGGINYAVRGDAHPGTIHGSLLVIGKAGSPVAHGMVKVLVETSIDILSKTPFLLPKSLYKLISADLMLDSAVLPLHAGWNENSGKSPSKWVLFEQTCSMASSPDDSTESTWRKDVKKTGISSFRSFLDWIPSPVRIAYRCPLEGKYCCLITDPCTDSSIMASGHPVLPHQQLLPSSLPEPYTYQVKDLHISDDITKELNKNNFFISTIQEEKFSRPDSFPSTPSYYDILSESGSLPTSGICGGCLGDYKGLTGGTCEKCANISPDCGMYCKSLCHVRPLPKFVSKHLIVTTPPYVKDSSRLVPRIVHQTWSETITKEDYPSGSRLMESWKNSGWEHHFYDNGSSREFLGTHFPPEILEAYDAILPGAFKADLFRYCVLFIHGGVYADMDLMLQSNLDTAIPPDVGFMTPLDAPGIFVQEQSCFWNGFMAAAPGHPFLAYTIERVVNGIRNRFTSMEIDDFLCPDVNFSVAHSNVVLYVTGPCILGASINKFLGRRPQTKFEPGDINPWEFPRLDSEEDDHRQKIPGRSIVLSKKHGDMGSHRFTWSEANIIVAMEASLKSERKGKATAHYSSSRVGGGMFGMENLYTDRDEANEDIKFIFSDHS